MTVKKIFHCTVKRIICVHIYGNIRHPKRQRPKFIPLHHLPFAASATLDVYLGRQPNYKKPTWSRRHPKPDQWWQGQVTVKPFMPFRVRLSVRPGFEPPPPHPQCLLAGTWERMARLPCWPPRGQQVSHQRLISGNVHHVHK